LNRSKLEITFARQLLTIDTRNQIPITRLAA
jgi:hypothetical protein